MIDGRLIAEANAMARKQLVRKQAGLAGLHLVVDVSLALAAVFKAVGRYPPEQSWARLIVGSTALAVSIFAPSRERRRAVPQFQCAT